MSWFIAYTHIHTYSPEIPLTCHAALLLYFLCFPTVELSFNKYLFMKISSNTHFQQISDLTLYSLFIILLFAQFQRLHNTKP